MVEARHEAGIALRLAADHRAAMRARVEPDADFALAVTGEVNGPAGQFSGLEAVGLLELGLVADVEPALVEDLGAFLREDGRVDHRLAVHLEPRHLTVVENVVGHVSFPLPWCQSYCGT